MCDSCEQVVAPKREALAEANGKLDGANKKLVTIRAKVKELYDRVAALEANLTQVHFGLDQFPCILLGLGCLRVSPHEA